MLFAGQVYEVEIACLFFFDWGHRWALGDVCWEAAAMTEHCRKSFVSGGVQEKDGAFDTYPLSSL